MKNMQFLFQGTFLIVMFIVDCHADFAPFAVYFVDIYQLLDSAVSVYLINYRISGWSIIRWGFSTEGFGHDSWLDQGRKTDVEK